VRGDDSYAAFEEILLMGKAKEVDFVLLGKLRCPCELENS